MYNASPLVTPRQDLRGPIATFMARQWASDLILPPMMVSEAAGVIPNVDVRGVMKRIDTRRNPKADYARIDTPTGTYSFACEDRGLEEVVDGRWARVYESWFRAEEVAAGSVVLNVLLDREAALAAALFNTTNFPLSGTTGLDTTVTWATSATATPIDDIGTAVTNIRNKTGASRLDLTVFGSEAGLEAAWRSTQVRNQLRDLYGNGIVEGNLNTNALAQVFGVGRVVVLECRQNTAAAGATPSMSTVWSESYIGVALLAPQGSRDIVPTPHLGRTLVFDKQIIAPGLAGGPATNMPTAEYLQIATYYEGPKQVVLATMMTDEAVWNSDCMFLIKID